MRGKWFKENGEWVYHEFWNGYSAKHYWEEQTRHQEFYAIKYPTGKEAEKLIKKIARHFKLRLTYEFNQRSNGHACYRWYGGHLRLPKANISLGLICHEIAHILAREKWGKNCEHNKKYQTQCNRVCRWAKRYLPPPKEEIVIPQATMERILEASQV